MTDNAKRIASGALIGAGVALFVILITRSAPFFVSRWLEQLENRLYDSRMSFKAIVDKDDICEEIVIVDIDPISIEELGSFKDWPHALHGRLIRTLSSAQPKAILFDILFDPEDTAAFHLLNEITRKNPPPKDGLAVQVKSYLKNQDPGAFAEETRKSGLVYHALFFNEATVPEGEAQAATEFAEFDFSNSVIHLTPEQAARLPAMELRGPVHSLILKAAKRNGFVNFPLDRDGVIRSAATALSIPDRQHVYTSLALSAAMDMLDIPQDGFTYDFDSMRLILKNRAGEPVRRIPIDASGYMKIHFYPPENAYQRLPYSYCLDPDKLPTEYFRDKIVLVGSTSLPGLADIRNTPVTESLPGVEIHAHLLRSILENELIREVPPAVNAAVLAAFCLVSGIVFAILRKPLTLLPVLCCASIAWIGFTYFQFLQRLAVWNVMGPVMGMLLTSLVLFLVSYTGIDKNQRYLKNTFGKYISPELIQQMVEKKEKPHLGGKESYMTALFTDLQNFTPISEKLAPARLVELLNEYLTEMTNELLSHKGTLDKYMGDAIIAFFGAPMAIPDHERCACITAVRMQERLAFLRQKWEREGDRWPAELKNIRCRIGINSGSMVTGNMGSELRMDYTMMGDAVNLASRLENLCRQYGVTTLVSESKFRTTAGLFIFRELDTVRVLGKNEPIRIYELLGEKGPCEAGKKVNNAPGKRDDSDGEWKDVETLLSLFHHGIESYRRKDWRKAERLFREAEKYELQFPGRAMTPSKVFMKRCADFAVDPPDQDWDGVWTLTAK